MKTFAQFLQSEEFFQWAPVSGTFAAEFHRRLRKARKIDSLLKLYAWYRLRYPDFYRDHQPFLDGTGKEAMARLWASYMEWADL